LEKKKTNSVEDIIDWVKVYPQESIDGKEKAEFTTRRSTNEDSEEGGK
jgi:hypothetical protein